MTNDKICATLISWLVFILIAGGMSGRGESLAKCLPGSSNHLWLSDMLASHINRFFPDGEKKTSCFEKYEITPL